VVELSKQKENMSITQQNANETWSTDWSFSSVIVQ